MSCVAVSSAPTTTVGAWYYAVRPSGVPASVSLFGFAKYATNKYIEADDALYNAFETHTEQYKKIYEIHGECIIYGYISNTFVATLIVKMGNIVHPLIAKEMCEYAGLPHVGFVACKGPNIIAISSSGVALYNANIINHNATVA